MIESIFHQPYGAFAFPISNDTLRVRIRVKKNETMRITALLGDRYQPGWKELDFLVIDGGYFPIEIDETGFIHQGKQTEDAIKDAFIMDYLKDYSPQPVRRIPGERLNTQELADYTAKELFP